MTYRTPEDHATSISEWRRLLAGKIRKVIFSVTGGPVWQLIGHKLFELAANPENISAEHFHGIGFYARPPDNSQTAEAIVANVGADSNDPVIIATRDEATRQLVDDVKADEAAMHNTVSRFYIANDGKLYARTHGGVTKRLLTVDEHNDFIANKFNTHTHAFVPAGPSPTSTPLPLGVAATGTTKFEAE